MESGPTRQQAAAGALGEAWFENNKRIFTVAKSAEHVGHPSKTQSSSCLKQFKIISHGKTAFCLWCNMWHVCEDGGRASSGVQTQQNHKVVLILLITPFVFFSWQYKGNTCSGLHSSVRSLCLHIQLHECWYHKCLKSCLKNSVSKLSGEAE